MAERYDLAVIGGGVVGLAILRRFAMAGLKTILLERGSDILSGASKGNSALLHTGFDAPPGSLELACMTAGRAEYLAIREALNLPLVESGALVVAWSEGERAALPAIQAKAVTNGVADVALLSQTALRRAEPRLAHDALGALLVPGEHIIDPWSAPLAYAHQALAHGATIWRDWEVTGGGFRAGRWLLHGANGAVNARVVVNAAGNFGDRVETLARPAPFRITPRKGQFVVFDKRAGRLVRAIILPVPSERTKGVVLFRTAFGNLAIGPTAEDQDSRDQAATDQPTLERLRARAVAMVPALAGCPVTASYAGLRPASNHQDYLIEGLEERHWITVAGIRSTGLTAALGIAQHAAALYDRHFGPLPAPPPAPLWTPVPNLCEGRPRPYETGGEILCHCEAVTRGELVAALAGPLPARDAGALRRRTRAMMGRCQGFYCSAAILALLREPVP